MKKLFTILILLLLTSLFLFSFSCGDDDDDDDDSAPADFNPDDFQTTVDNNYFPLVPGTVKTFEGDDGEEDLLVYSTVLTETETVAGVVCTVLKEEEYADGELVEISYNWFAQDITTGDVYYFGEDVDEYEDDEITGHPGAWKVGVDVDAPGFIFPGDPQLGDTFSPEAVPGEAEEGAEIVEVGLNYTTPYGDFTDVIKVEEEDLLGGEIEWKLYAPGVGLISELFEEGEMPLTEIE